MFCKRRIILLTGILIFLLTGCGQDETEENEGTNDMISGQYAVEMFSLEMDSGESGFPLPVLTGTRVYYVEKNGSSDYTLYCMDADNGETAGKTISMEGRTFNLVNFTADPEGNTYYALTIKPEHDDASQWERYIMKWNAEGEEVYFRKVTEDIGFAMLQMQVDGQGRLSFRYGRVYQFDENGQYLGDDEYVFDSEEAVTLHQQALSLEKFGINSQGVRDIVFLEDGRIVALVQSGTGSYELFVLMPAEA